MTWCGIQESAYFRAGDLVRLDSTGEVLRVVAVYHRPTPFALTGWEDEREQWLRRANEAIERIGYKGMTVERYVR